MVDRVHPYQENPLPIRGVLGQVELVREAATLVMLVTVGMLAGRTRHARLGYTAVAFGVWDIFYYVFLRVIGDWPRSLFDWDILFLLPLPWWGPVLAPVCIALLMIVGGTLASQPTVRRPATSLTRTLWRLQGLGIALALYVFMADSLRVVHQGLDATTTVLPQAFNWPVFCVAFTLMAAPVAQIGWRLRPPRHDLPAESSRLAGRASVLHLRPAQPDSDSEHAPESESPLNKECRRALGCGSTCSASSSGAFARQRGAVIRLAGGALGRLLARSHRHCGLWTP